MLTTNLKQRGWVEGCVTLILISGSKNAKDIGIQGILEKFRGNENIHKVLSSLANDVKIVEVSS